MRTDILMKLAEQQQQQKFNQLTEKSERMVESSAIEDETVTKETIYYIFVRQIIIIITK